MIASFPTHRVNNRIDTLPAGARNNVYWLKSPAHHTPPAVRSRRADRPSALVKCIFSPSLSVAVREASNDNGCSASERIQDLLRRPMVLAAGLMTGISLLITLLANLFA